MLKKTLESFETFLRLGVFGANEKQPCVWLHRFDVAITLSVVSE
jgi:hypothetical protein